MRLRKFIWLAALACGAPANAQFELVTLIEAVELSPANIILPGTITGLTTYRPCSDDCDKEYKRARLTEATTFTVEGRAVKFDEFRQMFATIKSYENSFALISVDVELSTVTNISISR